MLPPEVVSNPIFMSPIFWVSLVLAVTSVPVSVFVLKRQESASNARGAIATPVQDALAYVWVPLSVSGTVLMIGMTVAYKVTIG